MCVYMCMYVCVQHNNKYKQMKYNHARENAKKQREELAGALER